MDCSIGIQHVCFRFCEHDGKFTLFFTEIYSVAQDVFQVAKTGLDFHCCQSVALRQHSILSYVDIRGFVLHIFRCNVVSRAVCTLLCVFYRPVTEVYTTGT